MAKANKENDIVRELTLYVNRVYTKGLPKAKMQKAASAGTKEMIEQIRKRTQAGIDVKGSRLKPYSRSYRKWKKAFIKSGIPKKGKRKRGASTNARYRDLNNTTKWRAKKLPAHIRLTGKMFSNMLPLKPLAKYNNFRIDLRLRAYIKGKRNQKIYGYLQEMGRDFWGLSTNEKRRNKEVSAIRRTMLKVLGIDQRAIKT